MVDCVYKDNTYTQYVMIQKTSQTLKNGKP